MQILIKKIDLEKKKEFPEKPDYLTNQRWEKRLLFKSAADYNRCMASGYLQARMCQKAGIPNPQYGYSEKGKPYLLERERAAFNISHSGEYVVLAYHENAEPIGIDIQQLRFMKEGMERRILHKKERGLWEMRKREEKNPAIRTAADEFVIDKSTEFLNRIWTIKESYVKMTGDGLTLDFRHILIDFEKGIITSADRECAHFLDFEAIPGYRMAISTTKPFGIRDIQIEKEE